MLKTKWIKLGSAAAALAAGGGFALAGPASTAAAYFSPPLFLDVQVQSPAHLVAGGAAVSVPVVVTCTSPTASVTVQVTEKIGKATAVGYGSAEVGCTDAHETVLITAAAEGKAFAKGSAYATGTVIGCTPTICGSEKDSVTIAIRR